ncbi:CTP synthetase [Salinirubellus salinus]|uniref:CTP synthetase n=1 Tax=Salinirubellus salinus TaxID=1364945 RepID=A0A9E7U924_9EURY|nr:CTP synthetase [Salinirubellus salinus]UWM55471.1 CTP synthetase [Salinirubellus salinus]
MTMAVVAGPDEDGLGDALEVGGATVNRAGGTAARPQLEEAGIVDADLFVLTDARLATSIPVAKDLNPDVRVVVYARDTVPEFARGQAGHIVDPRLLDAETVAEELL